MTRWLKALAAVGVLVGGVLLLRLTVFGVKPVAVTVAEVGKGRVEDTVVNSRAGTVKSRLRAGMSPALAGLVAEVAVEKGARVKQGDLLLRLDGREHEAQVRLAESSLAAARSGAEQAKLEAEEAERQWTRTQALAGERVVSETVMDQERTRASTSAAARRSAEARVGEAEAALAVAAATLSKTFIRAPFDGVVLEVRTEVGEWISPSPPGVFIPPVVEVIDPDSLYVSAPIDEADVARLRVGWPVRITLDAFRGQSFQGELTYVSSFVETRQEQNRTLEVEAEFKETELPKNLLPGLSADLEIILAAREDVLRVPTYALLEGDRVLILEGGFLRERRVKTGLRNWSYAEVEEGVTVGERVVLSLDRAEVVAGARAAEARP